MSDTRLEVASSFLNMPAQCASLIPAAKSTEGEKGADDNFSTNSKTYQVSDQLNEEGRPSCANIPPTPLGHV